MLASPLARSADDSDDDDDDDDDGDKYSQNVRGKDQVTRSLHAHISMQGFRPTMEDSHVAASITAADGTAMEVFAVIDGHGGDLTARYLQSSLADAIQKHTVTTEPRDLCRALKAAFIDVDQSLSDIPLVRSSETSSTPSKKSQWSQNVDTVDHSGAVCVLALLTPEHILVANVGDARAVFMEERPTGEATLRSLSRDHTGRNDGEKSRVEAAGGAISDDNRVYATREDFEKKRPRSLEPSRTFGDFYFKQRGSGVIIADPEISIYRRWIKHDSLLILACDGVWDVFSSKDGAMLVRNQWKNEKADLEDACRNLLQESISRGSQDNLTSMAIVVKGRESQIIDEEDIRFIDTASMEAEEGL
eukprot:g2181.t1